MQFTSRNSAIVLFVLIGFVAVIECEDAKKEVLQLYDCKKIMGRIAKKILKTFSNCTKEVKAINTKEEFDKKMSCIIKCALDKLTLLTPEGIVTKTTIQKFMDDMVPEDAHEMAHALIEDCVEDHGAKLDPNQPYCESYGEFVTCMQNVFGEFADKANCGTGAFGRRRR